MNSPKNYLLLLFALSTLGVGVLAWQQYQELISLRAATLSADDRASLQKRLWAAERRARELESQLAAARNRGSDDPNAVAADAAAGPGGDQNRGDRPNRGNRGNQGPAFAAIRALMDKPEVQRLMAIQQKAMIDSRYAALFKNLNLSPEQTDKLKSLLAERQTAVLDVMSAAREQGLNPRSDPDGFRKLISDAQTEIDTNIKATVGDAGYAQLQQFEQTQPQRNLLNQLQQNLSYTSTPLTDVQANQLVQILASNSAQGSGEGVIGGFAGRGGGAGGAFMAALGGGDGFGGGGATITPAAVTQASSILASTQLQALQQLQQAQQAQQQMQQLVRQTAGGGAQGSAQGGAGAPNGAVPTKKRG